MFNKTPSRGETGEVNESCLEEFLQGLEEAVFPKFKFKVPVLTPVSLRALFAPLVLCISVLKGLKSTQRINPTEFGDFSFDPFFFHMIRPHSFSHVYLCSFGHNGRILTCHTGGLGLIPRQCRVFMDWNITTGLLS